MTSPKLAIEVNGVRKYKSPRSDKVCDSVTWATGNGIPKWGLNRAKIKLAVEHALDHPIGTMTVQSGQVRFIISSGPVRDQAVTLSTAASDRLWGQKADLGSAVHRLIEKRIRGEELGTWDAELKPYVETADKFIADFGPVFERVEMTVFSETHGYAGTLDAICRFANLPGLGLVLIDWKTGNLWPEAALQLAAYAHADYGIVDDEIVEMPKVERAGVVQIKPDGYVFREVRIDVEAHAYFLSALHVARWGSDSKRFMGTTFDPSVKGHEWDAIALAKRISALPLPAGLWLSERFIEHLIAFTPSTWSEVDCEKILTWLREAETNEAFAQ